MPHVLLVAALLFAWLIPYRVLMVWVYDRTQSLLMGYLMHVPITATTYILGSEVRSGTAFVIPVLVWGALFWVIVAVVAWTKRRPPHPTSGRSGDVEPVLRRIRR